MPGWSLWRLLLSPSSPFLLCRGPLDNPSLDLNWSWSVYDPGWTAQPLCWKYVYCLICFSYRILRMLRDGDYCNLIFEWTKIPENPVGSRSVLFCISLENLFPVWPFETGKLMCLQTVMAWIGCQQLNGFLYCLVAFIQGWIRLYPIIIWLALVGPENLKQSGIL